MAEYFSLGPVDPNTAMWMRDAARSGRMPTIAKLEQSTYFPYRYGQALWAFVASRYGEERVAEIYEDRGHPRHHRRPRLRGGAGFLCGLAVAGVEAHHPGVGDRRGAPALPPPPTFASAPPPRVEGRLSLGSRGDRGRLNVSPSLSPDGKHVAFLSERDRFSIELFVADATNGQVIHRLTRAALDPHLQSLQFINSAGAWSPDGKRLIVATVDRGVPALSILDPRTGRSLRQITFKQMGEVYHPTWSPDGKQVAFCGLVGARATCSSSISTPRRPGASPTICSPTCSRRGRPMARPSRSRRIASPRIWRSCATDHARLALFDLETGNIREVPGADQGKNINPQWASNDSSLYFVSDRSGISNVYRVNLASGAVAQVTDVPTGVTGITALSPAISVARGADRAVFSVFEKGEYKVRALDGAATLAGTAPAPATPRAAVLPPAEGPAGTTAAQEDSLPSDSSFQYKKYRGRLSLDSVGQIQLGVAAGAGGSVAVGEAARSSGATCWGIATSPPSSRSRARRAGSHGISPRSSRSRISPIAGTGRPRSRRSRTSAARSTSRKIR